MKARSIPRIWVMILLGGLTSATEAAEPISVVLSQPGNSGGTRTTIVVTIKDDGDAPVTLDRFFLPFDWNGPLPNSQFDVYSRDSQIQTYRGDWDYVSGRSPDRYIELGAHKTLSGTLDLWQSYDFDTKTDTRFTVQYRLPLGVLPEGTEPDENSPTYPADPNRLRTIESNVLEINVDPSKGIPPGEGRPGAWRGRKVEMRRDVVYRMFRAAGASGLARHVESGT